MQRDFLETQGIFTAKNCKPALKNILKTGGSAVWFDGANTRLLFHIPILHRPLTKWPWPFSILQPHICEYRIFAGDYTNREFGNATAINQIIFKYNESSRYILKFLNSVEPDVIILIQKDSKN